MMASPGDRDTLLEFPCRFPIKAFGEDSEGFEATVYELVKPHVPDLQPDDLSRNLSRGGRYVAVTVEIVARSKGQIDAIYADLTASDAVLMAL